MLGAHLRWIVVGCCWVYRTAIFTNTTVEKYDFTGLAAVNGKLSMRGSTMLKEVTLPVGITSCSPWGNAFNGCSSLVKVNNSEYLQVLPDAEFAGCTLLTTLDLSNVTTLGQQVFNGCGLEPVALPKLTTMNSWAFAWGKIKTLDLRGTTTINISNDGMDAPFHAIGTCDLKISSSTRIVYNGEDVVISGNQMTYKCSDGTYASMWWNSITID